MWNSNYLRSTFGMGVGSYEFRPLANAKAEAICAKHMIEAA